MDDFMEDLNFKSNLSEHPSKFAWKEFFALKRSSTSTRRRRRQVLRPHQKVDRKWNVETAFEVLQKWGFEIPSDAQSLNDDGFATFFVEKLSMDPSRRTFDSNCFLEHFRSHVVSFCRFLSQTEDRFGQKCYRCPLIKAIAKVSVEL